LKIVLIPFEVVYFSAGKKITGDIHLKNYFSKIETSSLFATLLGEGSLVPSNLQLMNFAEMLPPAKDEDDLTCSDIFIRNW
ncbi:hypothetical protein C0J52_28338, partial [Blattella germanica]